MRHYTDPRGQAQPCLLPVRHRQKVKIQQERGRSLPPIASVWFLWSRRPVLRARRRGPVRGRSGPVLLWRPVLLWGPVLRGRPGGRGFATGRPCGNWPVVGRTRPYRLDRRPSVVRRAIIIRRPVIPGRPVSRTANRTVEPRPVSRAVDGSGRPIIRWAVAPVAAVSRAVAINHGTGAIPDTGWPISAAPAAPWAAVVINPPASPVPSPATPSPWLADQKRGDADGNAKRD
jgi:hypothetical protein